MKNLLKIALTMLAAVTIGTSCNKNELKPTYSTYVTVVEGSWDIPYYIVFDDGSTAVVENRKDWTPSFTEEWKELRYIIYYTETDLQEPGYDKVVNIVAYQPVAINKLINVTDADFTGDDGLQKFTAKLDIGEAFFSPARNYLTLAVLIPYSDPGIKHTVKLVRHIGENSPYKDYYMHDDYLWLEAYHNNNDDSDSAQASTQISIKIDEAALGIGKLETFYKGIKIIYNSYNDNKVKTFTYDFKQQ